MTLRAAGQLYEPANSPMIAFTSGGHGGSGSSPAAEQNAQALTTETLYIFLGRGKGGTNVTEKGTNNPVNEGPDFDSLGANVKVIFVGGLAAYEDQFMDALRDPNSLGVLYIGHGAGEVGRIAGLQLNGLDSARVGGDFTNEKATKVSGINAPIIGIFSCGGSVVGSNFNSPAAVIAMNSGDNDVTSVPGLAWAGFGAAQAILSGANPNNVVLKANQAFKPIIALGLTNSTSSQPFLDRGDKVVRVK